MKTKFEKLNQLVELNSPRNYGNVFNVDTAKQRTAYTNGFYLVCLGSTERGREDGSYSRTGLKMDIKYPSYAGIIPKRETMTKREDSEVIIARLSSIKPASRKDAFITTEGMIQTKDDSMDCLNLDYVCKVLKTIDANEILEDEDKVIFLDTKANDMGLVCKVKHI